MRKQEVTAYNDVLVKADIDFIKYMVNLKKVKLIPGSGIAKVIEGVDHYLSLSPTDQITINDLKPLVNSYSISDSLRRLWIYEKEFGIQFKAMAKGDTEHGTVSQNMEHFLKDFELELFSASQLVYSNVDVNLPQTTQGDDIEYGDILIQCKHPDSITYKKIESILRDFQTRLLNGNKYGILGVGVEDFLNYKEPEHPLESEIFLKQYQAKLQQSEHILMNAFNPSLPNFPRILGVFFVNTHYTHTESGGLQLIKTTNSVYCIRPNARTKIPENIARKAYQAVCAFNDKPFILNF